MYSKDHLQDCQDHLWIVLSYKKIHRNFEFQDFKYLFSRISINYLLKLKLGSGEDK